MSNIGKSNEILDPSILSKKEEPMKKEIENSKLKKNLESLKNSSFSNNNLEQSVLIGNRNTKKIEISEDYFDVNKKLNISFEGVKIPKVKTFGEKINSDVKNNCEKIIVLLSDNFKTIEDQKLFEKVPQNNVSNLEHFKIAEQIKDKCEKLDQNPVLDDNEKTVAFSKEIKEIVELQSKFIENLNQPIDEEYEKIDINNEKNSEKNEKKTNGTKESWSSWGLKNLNKGLNKTLEGLNKTKDLALEGAPPAYDFLKNTGKSLGKMAVTGGKSLGEMAVTGGKFAWETVIPSTVKIGTESGKFIIKIGEKIGPPIGKTACNILKEFGNGAVEVFNKTYEITTRESGRSLKNRQEELLSLFIPKNDKTKNSQREIVQKILSEEDKSTITKLLTSNNKIFINLNYNKKDEYDQFLVQISDNIKKAYNLIEERKFEMLLKQEK